MMYEEFFQLAEMPFNNTPDPRFFYQTPQHEEALASLLFTIHERKGYALLTGEVGAGKTLVARQMLRKLEGAIESANIINSFLTPRELLVRLAYEFCLPHDPMASSAELGQTIQSFLLERFAQNIPVVVIIDEAQNLSDDTLEQIRMIGNLESDHSKLLQIIIMGQPEFRERLAGAKLKPLAQRIFQAYHLPAMSADETAGYIEHRLRVAGAARPELFHGPAIEAIHQYAGGVPRIINHLCDHALLSAYIAERNVVTVETVRQVVRDSMPELNHRRKATLPAPASVDRPVDFPVHEATPPSRNTVKPAMFANNGRTKVSPSNPDATKDLHEKTPAEYQHPDACAAANSQRRRRLKEILDEVRGYTERNIRATYESVRARDRSESWSRLAEETDIGRTGRKPDATDQLLHRLRELTALAGAS